MWSSSSILYAGALVRLVLIFWGEVQDHFFVVKYTDVDYAVFTDAARYVASGQSPYARSTYRYSPVISYMLIPNVLFFPGWGKVLFSAGDVLAAWLLLVLGEHYNFSKAQQSLCVFLWLFNPYTLTISTRGSCDVLVACVLLLILVFTCKNWLWPAAFLFGFSVHFRIYPIIYAPSLALYVLRSRMKQRSLLLAAANVALLGLWSAVTFLLLGVFCYQLYGMQFVEEAFTYHLSRQDHRHNFSVYYYSIYLGYLKEDGQKLAPDAVAFLPQGALQLLFAGAFHDDLPLCWLLQTISFVAFNKVCTAQYFVWYFSLLPLLLVRVQTTKFLGLACAGWVVTQLNWLWWAYLLEFQGLPTFLAIWASSLLFLGGNVIFMIALMQAYFLGSRATACFKA